MINRIDKYQLKDIIRLLLNLSRNLIIDFLKWNQKVMENRIINYLMIHEKRNKI